ncbi:MAG: GGDEF domain-containing protein [Eubacterium sp.]|nr:GGDEF domain-containing protein [Eubacterium sp.]
MKIRPLNRSITIVTIIFVILLTAVLSFGTYHLFTRTMYDRYKKQMASIVTYVQSYIDDDDLSECADTYEESEKYKELQELLDRIVDNYEDLHYIYIMQVLDKDAPVRVIEVCTGNSTYEKENEPEMVLHLGDGEADWYDAETAEQFWQIEQGDKDVYMFEDSEWGTDYTLFRPLVDSSGKHYAMLCVDVGVDEIRNVIHRTIYITIALIVVGGLLFIIAMLFWSRVNIIDPIDKLEKSVTDFAEQSAGRKDPEDLIYAAPDLKVNNEVRKLSDAVTTLSVNMKEYIKDKLEAEHEKKDFQAKAYRDALTNVKNRAAYQKKEETLVSAIASGDAEFGIVMVDANNLKYINDKYGHEHGNELIIGVCNTICQVFKHSPVFRVGGDEFVAVIRGQDYDNREELVAELRRIYRENAEAADREPWERCSAAVGLAVYEKGDSAASVFNRADQEMYKEKVRMKAERE